jgi:predicted O-linked N-acetylglucosamine transferase (SPINDLY family)
MKNQRKHAASGIEAALQHHRAGRLQQAETLYKQMPNNPDALHLRGVILHQWNKNEEAVESIGKAIGIAPANPAYCFSIDPVYRALDRLDDVAACYQSLLKRTPNNADAHNNLGNAFKDQGKPDDAVACYQKALAIKPDFAEAHTNLGVVLTAQNRLDEAATCYRKALSLKPDFAEVHTNLGIVLAAQRELEQAVACYQKAIALKPDFVGSYLHLGGAFKAQGKLEEATACYRNVLALQPDFFEAHYNLGCALKDQGKLDEAVTCYLHALELKPDFVDGYMNLGNVLREQRKLAEAVTCYQNILTLKPESFEAHYNLGIALKEQGRLNEAVTCYLNAIALKLDFAEAYNNLGRIFIELGNPDEALGCYQTALTLEPDFAEAHNNLGLALKDRGRLDEAMACYRKALALKPDYAPAHNNQGLTLHLQGRPDEAIACYERALSHQPNYAVALSNLLLSLQYSATYAPEQIFAAHLRFAEQFEPPLKAQWQAHPNPRDPNRRLKIGYVSPDFCSHPVAHFIEPALACHDKSQVEVFCYYNRDHYDHLTHRIKALADHWVPCRDMSDDELAQRIRTDGIDILIDLAGHTGENRLLTFARKPAPVQATYLGYPATTGLTAIDYRITDIHAEPPGMTERFNVEQLCRLPEIFCCYRASDNSPPVIGHAPLEDNGYVTFGCFNNFAKVSDPVLALWAKLLHTVPSARLMLEIHGIDNPLFRAEVESRMRQVGLPVERLHLIPKLNANQYVLYNRIDIALDPFPCNGGTTSLDTVWMGVPFVTLAGGHFTSRMGVTILTNAGMPELIAGSEDEYVQIAAALALDPARLKRLRAGLRERVQAGPLMDAARFTRHLEQAYRGMWQQWIRGSGGK